ncbi:hypothetical protein SAMN02745108_00354 [Fibrobacter intestinalis]|uniref:Uncharacterized protein n=1 Tax=Fibrobacter intestinalis TaxID=28122 RepID=A0A1T4K8Q1_9BACT|nr:hypothetical protein BGW94_2626 [Fibrobacter sp. NR9]SJZ38804.1 hypothetical protein SAMN02745108_00354 [Fibrobacter intestinalis]
MVLCSLISNNVYFFSLEKQELFEENEKTMNDDCNRNMDILRGSGAD